MLNPRDAIIAGPRRACATPARFLSLAETSCTRAQCQLMLELGDADAAK
jgi:hypothetical protein